MNRNITMYFLLLMSLGCATAYQREGLTGGYSELQFDDNVYQVAFRGNGYTSDSRAADFTLLRCAELALERDYRYFIIVDSETASSQSSYTTPSRSYTTGTAHATGSYVHGSATTTTTGGQTYVISKPSSTNTIVCFRERPDIVGLVLDAAMVCESIRERYGLVH